MVRYRKIINKGYRISVKKSIDTEGGLLTKKMPKKWLESWHSTSGGEKIARVMGGTAAASLAASAFGLHMPWTVTVGERDYTAKAVTAAEAPKQQEEVEVHSTTIPETSEDVQSRLLQMPWSPEFNLEDAPAYTREIIGSYTVDQLANELREKVDGGYEIRDIAILSFASDEARIAPEYDGLGESNQGNVDLAYDRGEVVLERLQQAGLDTTGATVTAAENVLSADDVTAVKNIAAVHDVTTAELLDAYNMGGDMPLSPEELETMNAMLGRRRGAIVSYRAVKPEETIDEKTVKPVCVYKRTLTERQGHINGLPITIIPAVIPRFTRKNKSRQEDDKEQEDDSKGDSDVVDVANNANNANNANAFSYETEKPARHDVSGVSAILKDKEAAVEEALAACRAAHSAWLALQSDQSRPIEEVSKARYEYDKAGEAHYLACRDLDRYIEETQEKARRSESLRSLGRTGLRIAAIAAIIAIPRLHFGYCPDRHDTTLNPFRAEFPDRVAVSFSIPFTDLSTGELTVLDSGGCPKDASGDDSKPCDPDRIDTTIVHADGSIEEVSQAVRKR